MSVRYGCLCAVLLIAGCGDDSVVRPPGPGPSPTPTPVTYTVSGSVRTADGAPVSGARVVVLEQEWASAISDEHGAYSIGGVRPSYQTISPLLSASKAGFFTATEFASGDYRPITADTRLDLLMMPLVTVPVGETLHGRVIAGAEHPCSNYGYGTTDCQRFAMTMPATGFLEITLSGPTFKHDVDVVGPDGTFVLYDASWSTPQRYTIGVHAGSTYEIRVAIFTGVDFDLSTTLRVESTSPLRAR